MKYARIIKGIAEKQNISIEEALDRFYHSVTSPITVATILLDPP